MDRLSALPNSYKLVRRDARPNRTVVRLPNGASFGGETIAICAGPCSVESREQIEATAQAVAACGANVLRGGAFKPRTSPYAFQGLGAEGLKFLRDAADRFGMCVVTEVLDPREVETVARYADMLQIGTRNMQNFTLLREAGEARKPVLLKRGLSATIEEWLLAAEYLLVAGNDRVVLCERGVRSFDSSTRNLLDLAAIPLVHSLSHLPLIVDPSHGTGSAKLVGPMAAAAIAAGADGLLVEVHPDPPAAASDGPQSLTFEQFETLIVHVTKVAEAFGRQLPKQGSARGSATKVV
ncbi:MAG TPA: 3-deoxy-7-phosphoheptulonate synthase [Candidatus Rubrimentiphilum sp.]|nr:3-deoxy-7-phosphoheptulonate synthase [Candidatus Rubrimentiphilum sp.]